MITRYVQLKIGLVRYDKNIIGYLNAENAHRSAIKTENVVKTQKESCICRNKQLEKIGLFRNIHWRKLMKKEVRRE